MDKIKDNIFLIDAIGALCSFLFLFGILKICPEILGFKPKIFYKLLPFALGFFAYSICNHYLISKRWRFSLRLGIIASANAAYGLYTMYLVFVSNEPQEMYLLAQVLITLEFIIILGIVMLEFYFTRVNMH